MGKADAHPSGRRGSIRIFYPRSFALIALVTVLLWATGFGFLKSRYDEAVEGHLERQSETQRVAWQAVTNMHQVGMGAYFDSYIMQPTVIALLKKASNADEKTQNAVRGQLLIELHGAYDSLISRGVRQLQFHTPQTHSFLRFHQPERYGDSLVKERPLVVKANRELVPTYGFETGRVISGFRNIFPIVADGKHLGTVELSQPFEYLRRELVRLDSKREYLLVLSAKEVLPKIFEENRQFYAPSCLGEEWLVEDPKREWPDASPPVTVRAMQLGQTLSSRTDMAARLDAGEMASFSVENGAGSRHYVTLTPVHDVEQKLAAYLVSFAPAPELDRLLANLRSQTALLTLFLLLFATVFYRFLSGRHELEALNKNLAAKVESEVALRLNEVGRLQHEKEIQQSLLIQQSKQAEIGSMIGAIAHQWKQPLNTIAVMTQTLMDAYEDGVLSKPELAAHIHKVMEQIGFMSETINDFRNFYKPSKAKELFVLKTAVAAVGSLLKTQLDQHNAGLKIEGDDTLQAMGYPSEFKQVILNLINNAKEAAPEGQRCEITARIFKEGNQAVVTVTDNAGGIEPELLPEKLFEPFNTTKGEAGTGVGLSLSRMIIEEKMDGALRAANVEGGAQFRIELPL